MEMSLALKKIKDETEDASKTEMSITIADIEEELEKTRKSFLREIEQAKQAAKEEARENVKALEEDVARLHEMLLSETTNRDPDSTGLIKALAEAREEISILKEIRDVQAARLKVLTDKMRTGPLLEYSKLSLDYKESLRTIEDLNYQINILRSKLGWFWW